MQYDVIIIGGGIIGFSTAWQLLRAHPNYKIAVIEKEADLAQHQTGHNSGVIHAGVYYTPGSLKAKFCVAGCRATKDFCDEHHIPYKVPGKLIVATNEQELEWMAALQDRCQQNGLTVELLTAAPAQKRQPGLNTAGAFLVKETGIVDWRQVCRKYAELFTQLGGTIHYQQRITGIRETNSHVKITTHTGQQFASEYVITCAGLFADRLVKYTGLQPDFKIIPFRGEYYQLAAQYNDYFKHLIYPVPDPNLPFLGVHFTPQMAGFTTIGPSAVLALAREGYHWGKINLRDCLEVAAYPPFWRLLFNHFKATCDELAGSLSTNHYLKHIHKYFPDIQRQDIKPYPAGVRAQALGKDGKLINDFLFMNTDRILHTCNAPSPAATSSLPIGEYIVQRFAALLTS